MHSARKFLHDSLDSRSKLLLLLHFAALAITTAVYFFRITHTQREIPGLAVWVVTVSPGGRKWFVQKSLLQTMKQIRAKETFKN